MTGMGAHLLTISILLLFTFLPGAWLAYGWPLAVIRWPARVALSGALSPLVLALEMLLLKTVGFPFGLIPTTLLLVNLPALLLIGHSWRQGQFYKISAAGIGSSALFFGILVVYLLLPWSFVPMLRPFAWHALWHTDITYMLTHNRLLPEEPELAGLILDYSWLGHVYWSVIGWSTNLPPTILYALSNLIWLGLTSVLAYEVGVSGLHLGRPAAFLSVGLTCLGTNALGALAWTLHRDWHWQQRYLGDLRYTPLLGKYLGFETMPFAFALLLAVMLLCLLALQRPLVGWAAPLAVSLAGVGLLYPILLPVGCLLVGGLWLLLVTRLDPVAARYTGRSLGWIAVGIGISLVSVLFFLALITQERSHSAVHWTPWASLKPKLFHLVSAFFLFGPALLPIATGLLQRTGARLLLTATGLGALALYVVADLDALEYKYVLAATLVVAPLAAAGVERLLAQRVNAQWGVALVTMLSLVALHQTLMLQVGALIPANLQHAPVLDESAFLLALAPTDPNAAWTAAIRTQTPENTMVVAQPSTIHLGSFVARALYAPSDRDGTQSSGYSVDNRFNLLTWRGYPVSLYDARLQVVKTVYSTTDVTAMRAALTALLALQRPVAFQFTPDVPMYQWLRRAAIGHALFTSATYVVWLVAPSVGAAQPVGH